MDILTLSTGSLNFILYCLMSSQFRTTLISIFWRRTHEAGQSRAAEVRMMDEAYKSKRKQKSQKQAGYVDFLKDSDLPAREKFLHILKIEVNELDIEIEKKLK